MPEPSLREYIETLSGHLNSTRAELRKSLELLENDVFIARLPEAERVRALQLRGDVRNKILEIDNLAIGEITGKMQRNSDDLAAATADLAARNADLARISRVLGLVDRILPILLKLAAL